MPVSDFFLFEKYSMTIFLTMNIGQEIDQFDRFPNQCDVLGQKSQNTWTDVHILPVPLPFTPPRLIKISREFEVCTLLWNLVEPNGFALACAPHVSKFHDHMVASDILLF